MKLCQTHEIFRIMQRKLQKNNFLKKGENNNNKPEILIKQGCSIHLKIQPKYRLNYYCFYIREILNIIKNHQLIRLYIVRNYLTKI